MVNKSKITSRPFAVFDIDGTIFRSSLFIELLEECIRKEFFPEYLYDQIAKAKKQWLERESRDSYDKYLDELVSIFQKNIKGLNTKQLVLVADSVVERMHRQSYVYTRDLLQNLKKTHFTLAISGSPYEIVSKFCNKYEFDAFMATEYHNDNGILNGRITKRHTNKGKFLDQIIEEYSLTLENSYAVGDSGGDIELLEKVKNPIAFNPDKILLDHAIKKGWTIVVERKNVVYELGHHRGEYKLL